MSKDEIHEIFGSYPGIRKLYDLGRLRQIVEFDFICDIHAPDFDTGESGDLGEEFEYSIKTGDAPNAEIHIRITNEGFARLAEDLDCFSVSELKAIDDACAQEAEMRSIVN